MPVRMRWPACSSTFMSREVRKLLVYTFTFSPIKRLRQLLVLSPVCDKLYTIKWIKDNAIWPVT